MKTTVIAFTLLLILVSCHRNEEEYIHEYNPIMMELKQVLQAGMSIDTVESILNLYPSGSYKLRPVSDAWAPEEGYKDKYSFILYGRYAYPAGSYPARTLFEKWFLGVELVEFIRIGFDLEHKLESIWFGYGYNSIVVTNTEYQKIL